LFKYTLRKTRETRKEYSLSKIANFSIKFVRKICDKHAFSMDLKAQQIELWE
jgi:hypothetical protein